jgi:hypothetical protein
VSSTACSGWTFVVFSLIFGARSTHLRRLLVDTRYPAEVHAVFRPGCWKLRSCWSLELGAWPSRTRASLFSFCACRPRSALSSRAWRRLGSPVSVLRPGASGCGACPTRAVTPAKQPPFFTDSDFFRVFCLCVVFSLVSMYSLPLCGLSFTRIFLVRGLYVILVKFEILLDSCF